MSKYMQQLRIQAGWRTWADVLRSQREAQEYEDYFLMLERVYGKAYADDYRERERQRQEKRMRERARDALLNEKLSSLRPVNDWVGAAWVDPKGNLYPVRYCNHSNRAEELAPHHYSEEVERIRKREGWLDCGAFLSHEKGWLRIGADGLVGDHSWCRVREMTQAQLDAIAAMHERGKVVGTHDYRETGGFLSGLHLSVRYAMGEVNANGETPEEVAKRHHEEHKQRRIWRQEEHERRKKWHEREKQWAREREQLLAALYG